jgi:hypothetical protein
MIRNSLLAGAILVTLTVAIGVGFEFNKITIHDSSPCGEGIHVTHFRDSVNNLAVKRIDSGTWGATNNTGYFILPICTPVGAIITFQGADYGFQLEPHQIIEAKL